MPLRVISKVRGRMACSRQSSSLVAIRGVRAILRLPSGTYRSSAGCVDRSGDRVRSEPGPYLAVSSDFAERNLLPAFRIARRVPQTWLRTEPGIIWCALPGLRAQRAYAVRPVQDVDDAALVLEWRDWDRKVLHISPSGRQAAGASYVVFGAAGGFPAMTIDASDADLIIQGEELPLGLQRLGERGGRRQWRWHRRSDHRRPLPASAMWCPAPIKAFRRPSTSRATPT